MSRNTYKTNKLFFLKTLILLVVFVLNGCLAKEIKQVKSNQQAVEVGKKVEAESEKQDSIDIEKQNEEIDNNIETVEINTDNVDISDWLAYKNEKYGFEVMLPKNWTANSEYDGSTLATSPTEFPDNPLILTGQPPAIDFQIEFMEDFTIEKYNSFMNNGSKQLIKYNNMLGLKKIIGNSVLFMVQTPKGLIKLLSNDKNFPLNDAIFASLKLLTEKQTDNTKENNNEWLTYRNEKLGVEFKYPDGWYLVDYSSEFKIKDYFMLGLYPPSKKRDYEYMGDIEVRILQKNINENIEQYYKKTHGAFPEYSEKTKKELSLNNYSVIFEYNVSGNIISDDGIVDCGNKIVLFTQVSFHDKNILENITNSILCFD